MTRLFFATLLLFLIGCNNHQKKSADPENSIVTATISKNEKSDTASVQVISALDKEFVIKAGMANSNEVQTGKLAVERSTDVRVTDFGRLMITNHKALQQELKTTAALLSLTAPDHPDSMEVELQNKLIIVRSKSFDKLYSAAQIQDQEAVVALFKKQIEKGTNPLLKAFAIKNLPLLVTHLEKARLLPVKG